MTLRVFSRTDVKRERCIESGIVISLSDSGLSFLV